MILSIEFCVNMLYFRMRRNVVMQLVNICLQETEFVIQECTRVLANLTYIPPKHVLEKRNKMLRNVVITAINGSSRVMVNPARHNICQLRRSWRAESTTCLRVWGQLPNQRRQHVRHCFWHHQGRRSNQFPNLVVLALHEQHFFVNSWMFYHQHFEDRFWQTKEQPGLLENKILSSKLNQ